METGLVDEPYLSPRLGTFQSMYKNREIQGGQKTRKSDVIWLDSFFVFSDRFISIDFQKNNFAALSVGDILQYYLLPAAF